MSYIDEGDRDGDRAYSGEPERRIRDAKHAREYVANVCCAILDNEFNHPDRNEGWMFGGVEHDADRKLITAAIRALQRKLLK